MILFSDKATTDMFKALATQYKNRLEFGQVGAARRGDLLLEHFAQRLLVIVEKVGQLPPGGVTSAPTHAVDAPDRARR